MKRKYYMRGLGIGVIVTAILFTLIFPKNEPAMTDDEVIARARELGYTKKSEGITPEDIDKIKEQDNLTTTPEATKEITPEPTGTPGPTPSPEPTPEAPKPPEQPDTPVSPTPVAEQEKPTPTPKPTSPVTQKPTETPVPSATMAPASGAEDTVTIKVERGMTASKVSQLLQKAGAVEDSTAFVSYLRKEKLTDAINIGTFSIPQGATYEEIATILTK